MIPSLRKLHHALLLAESGNYAVASKHMHLTQSALTRSIQSLEQELGLVIFDRSQKGVRVTPDGKVLLEKARALILHANKFSEEVVAIKQPGCGRVSLGFGPGIQSLFLPQMLVQICQQYPKISINVEIESVETLLSLLIREQLEFIVADSLHLRLEKFGLLDTQPLVTLPIQVYARSGHPLAQAGLSPEQVQAASEQYPQIYVQFDALQFHPVVGGLPPTTTLIRCNDLASLNAVLVNTDGLLVAIEAMVRPSLQEGLAVALPVTPPQTETTVSLIKLKRHTFSSSASVAASWIERHLQFSNAD